MSPDSTTVLSHDDLRVVAQAMLLRFPLRAPESRRVARLRELLDTSAALTRSLATQLHSARVHCQGSYGTGDLLKETDELCTMLAAFAGQVRAVATEYRAVVDDESAAALLPA